MAYYNHGGARNWPKPPEGYYESLKENINAGPSLSVNTAPCMARQLLPTTDYTCRLKTRETEYCSQYSTLKPILPIDQCLFAIPEKKKLGSGSCCGCGGPKKKDMEKAPCFKFNQRRRNEAMSDEMRLIQELSRNHSCNYEDIVCPLSSRNRSWIKIWKARAGLTPKAARRSNAGSNTGYGNYNREGRGGVNYGPMRRGRDVGVNGAAGNFDGGVGGRGGNNRDYTSQGNVYGGNGRFNESVGGYNNDDGTIGNGEDNRKLRPLWERLTSKLDDFYGGRYTVFADVVGGGGATRDNPVSNDGKGLFGPFGGSGRFGGNNKTSIFGGFEDDRNRKLRPLGDRATSQNGGVFGGGYPPNGSGYQFGGPGSQGGRNGPGMGTGGGNAWDGDNTGGQGIDNQDGLWDGGNQKLRPLWERVPSQNAGGFGGGYPPNGSGYQFGGPGSQGGRNGPGMGTGGGNAWDGDNTGGQGIDNQDGLWDGGNQKLRPLWERVPSQNAGGFGGGYPPNGSGYQFGGPGFQGGRNGPGTGMGTGGGNAWDGDNTGGQGINNQDGLWDGGNQKLRPLWERVPSQNAGGFGGGYPPNGSGYQFGGPGSQGGRNGPGTGTGGGNAWDGDNTGGQGIDNQDGLWDGGNQKLRPLWERVPLQNAGGFGGGYPPNGSGYQFGGPGSQGGRNGPGTGMGTGGGNAWDGDNTGGQGIDNQDGLWDGGNQKLRPLWERVPSQNAGGFGGGYPPNASGNQIGSSSGPWNNDIGVGGNNSFGDNGGGQGLNNLGDFDYGGNKLRPLSERVPSQNGNFYGGRYPSNANDNEFGGSGIGPGIGGNNLDGSSGGRPGLDYQDGFTGGNNRKFRPQERVPKQNGDLEFGNGRRDSGVGGNNLFGANNGGPGNNVYYYNDGDGRIYNSKDYARLNNNDGGDQIPGVGASNRRFSKLGGGVNNNISNDPDPTPTDALDYYTQQVMDKDKIKKSVTFGLDDESDDDDDDYVMVKKVTTIRKTYTQPEELAKLNAKGGTQKAPQAGTPKAAQAGTPKAPQEGTQAIAAPSRPSVDWNLFAGLLTGRIPNIGKAYIPNDVNSKRLKPLETVPKMDLMKPDGDQQKKSNEEQEEDQRNAVFQQYKAKSELFKRHNPKPKKQKKKRGGSHDSDSYIMVKTVRTINKTTTHEDHHDDDDDD